MGRKSRGKRKREEGRVYSDREFFSIVRRTKDIKRCKKRKREREMRVGMWKHDFQDEKRSSLLSLPPGSRYSHSRGSSRDYSANPGVDDDGREGATGGHRR